MRFAMLAACPALVISCSSAQFADASYTEAFDRAVKEDKLFLVHATAVWCGPCKMMDRDTYGDPEVRAWMEANTVAVKVDVDEQPDRAEELGIRAMPTMVVFKGGEEFDRVTGYRGPEDFVGWLENVKAGKNSLDALKERTGSRTTDARGKVDIQSRLEVARELLQARKYEEATEEYVWLWGNMLEHDEAYYGVRLSFMTAEMGRLARESDHARERFTKLRDETEQRLKADPNWDDLGDWIQLNIDVVDGEDRVLNWVDRNIDDAEGRATIRRFLHTVENLLMDQAQWKALGTLVENPRSRIDRERMFFAIDAGGERHREFREQRYAQVTARQTVALLAAGRADDAMDTLHYALKFQPELEYTRAFKDIWDAYPDTRQMVGSAINGRHDVPEALAEAMR